MPRRAENRPSLTEQQSSRAAFREAVPAVVLLVLAQAVLYPVDLDAGRNPWHLALALLPLPPALLVMWGQARNLRRADEYQRILQLEALAVGFAAALLIAMTGGFVMSAGYDVAAPVVSATFVGGILAWEIALALRTRSAR